MFRYFLKKFETFFGKLKLFFFFFLLSSSIFSDSISITSDRLEVTFTEASPEFVFSQNVQIRTPSFSAQCTRAHVTTSGEIQQLSCELGNIKHVEIIGPIHFVQGERSCDSDYAEIIPSESIIILKGNAVVNDPLGTISAAEIRINYVTRSIDISGKTNLPVQITIDPEKKSCPSEPPIEHYIYTHEQEGAQKFTATQIPYPLRISNTH